MSPIKRAVSEERRESNIYGVINVVLCEKEGNKGFNKNDLHNRTTKKSNSNQIQLLFSESKRRST